MSEAAPKTGGEQPAGTGGSNPTATPPQGTPTAPEGSAIPEGYELIRTEDKNNLVAARDRSNNANSDLEDSVTDILKEREINKFLKGNAEKYPDVTADDLMIASSPDELEAVATKQQRRIEDAVQAKLLSTQKATAPVLSPQERAAELKKLKDSPDKNSFGRMLELQESQTT